MGYRLLLVAAFLSAAITALHVVIIFVGAPGYRYFGAGEEMARQAENGSLFPAALTFLIALVFALFSAYALSAAGVIRRLPLLKTGLVVIGFIYTLRGLTVIAQAAQLQKRGLSLLHRELVFSGTSLVIGIVYLAVTAMMWRHIGRR